MWGSWPGWWLLVVTSDFQLPLENNREVTTSSRAQRFSVPRVSVTPPLPATPISTVLPPVSSHTP